MPRRKATLPPIPAALADVSLIDGPTCAASAGMSLSAWHEAVRLGDAPAPVVRLPRCTRWRMADVRAWLVDRAERQMSDDRTVAPARRATAPAA